MLPYLSRAQEKPEVKSLVVFSVLAGVASSWALAEVYDRLNPGHGNVLRSPLVAVAGGLLLGLGWAEWTARSALSASAREVS